MLQLTFLVRLARRSFAARLALLDTALGHCSCNGIQRGRGGEEWGMSSAPVRNTGAEQLTDPQLWVLARRDEEHAARLRAVHYGEADVADLHASEQAGDRCPARRDIETAHGDVRGVYRCAVEWWSGGGQDVYAIVCSARFRTVRAARAVWCDLGERSIGKGAMAD